MSPTTLAPVNIIRTTDLMLEPQTAAHADELFVVFSDPAICAYENEAPACVERLRVRFTQFESRRSPGGKQRGLNAAVAAAYGELDYTPPMPDEEILRRLLALNRERSAG